MGCCATFQRFLTIILYLAGIGLSGYAYYVEVSKERDPEFVALCDLNDKMSCSRVLTSKWGKGFGLVGPLLGDDHVLNQANALYGIVFYSLNGLLYLCGRKNRFIASFLLLSFVIASIMSVYLGFILFAVLEDLCVLCVSTYGVNFLLLGLSICNKRSARPPKPSFRRDEPIIGNFKKNI